MSPRKRAQKTLELLDLGCHERLPWKEEGTTHGEHDLQSKAKVQVTEDIREWDYGDYEGLTSKTIRERRKQSGEKEAWDIWRDGCPGGEYARQATYGSGCEKFEADTAEYRSPEDVTKRLDRLISDIRSRFHSSAIGKPREEAVGGDVLLVAHGHILRAFAMRWVGRKLTDGVSLLLEGMVRYPPKPLTLLIGVCSWWCRYT